MAKIIDDAVKPVQGEPPAEAPQKIKLTQPKLMDGSALPGIGVPPADTLTPVPGGTQPMAPNAETAVAGPGATSTFAPPPPIPSMPASTPGAGGFGDMLQTMNVPTIQNDTFGAQGAMNGLTPQPTPQVPLTPQAGGQTGASWMDAQGNAQNSATPPVGTPYYASAALVPDKNTGAMTSTAQGDASNAFKGYVGPEGGSFGGAFAGQTNPQAWSAVANGDPQAIQSALSGNDPALQGVAAKEIAKMLDRSDQQANGIAMMSRLTPEQQAMVKSAFLDPKGLLAADQGGDPNRANQQALYEGAWNRLQSQFAAPTEQAPTGRLPGLPPAGPAAGGQAEAASQLAGGVKNAPTLPMDVINAPTDAGGQYAPTPTPAGPKNGGIAPTETAAPIAGGVRNVPTQTPSGPSALPGLTPTQGYDTAPSKTATTAQNALTNQTLDYGPLADRFKLAQSELENWNQSTNPQFQADLRDAMRKAAAGGALGSGMLQTSIGDLAKNRELQRQSMGTSFLNNALGGSIQDAKDRANFAAGQQQFQQGQQQSAFDQAIREALTNDQLTGNAFQRSLQQLITGQSNDPSQILMGLSGIFGNAGSQAGQSLADLIRGKTGGASSNGGGGSDFMALLRQYLGKGGTSAPPKAAPDPIYTPTGAV